MTFPGSSIEPVRLPGAPSTAGNADAPTHMVLLYLAFVALLVIASSFNYLFLGSLPLWVIPAAAIFALAAVDRRVAHRAGQLAGATPAILWGWFLFLWVTLALDLFSGLPGRSFTAGFLLNFLGLAVFAAAAIGGSLISTSRLLTTIAAIALAQGLLCLAQAAGQHWAWDLSSSLFRLFGRSLSAEVAESMQQFVDIRRVRGSHLFVHTFNAMQASLVAYLFALLVAEGSPIRGLTKGARLFIFISAVVGAVGVALTFSRASFGGLAIALLLIVATNFRARVVGVTALAALATGGAAILAGFDQYGMGARLFGFSSTLQTNAARLEHVNYTWTVFQRSPLIGLSNGAAPQYELSLPIHSVFLRMVADYGLVGAVFYVAIVGAVLWLFLRDLRDRNLEVRAYALGGLCVFIIFMTDSWTHSSGFLRKDVYQTCLFGVVSARLLAARHGWRAGALDGSQSVRRASRGRSLGTAASPRRS